MKNKAKELWLKWLEDNGAERIKELDCGEFSDQIHGYIDIHYCVAFFRTNHVTLTAYGKTFFDVPIDEFEDTLHTLKPHVLERFELGENEYIKIESEIENGVSKTFYSLIKN